MLDGDAYLEPGETSGGSTSGGSANLPRAGAQNVPTPTGGTGNTPSPSPILASCQKYCAAFMTKCPQQFEPGRDCVAACQAEVGNGTKDCQNAGLKALKCLTPYFAKQGLICDAAVAEGLSRCSEQLNTFNRCSGQDVPTPDPVPMPACSSMGDAGDTYCKASYSCGTSFYTTACSYGEAGWTCECSGPNGALQTPLGDGLPNVCNLAALLCGAPVQWP